jgi:hypothetical protein
MDILPQEMAINTGYPNICMYSYPMGGKCPCSPMKAPEPSPEVLEEIQHQKTLKQISRDTQKLVHELQYAKMKLAVLKLTKEIEQTASSTVSSEPVTNTEANTETREESQEEEEEE